jgi:hypothetical protein
MLTFTCPITIETMRGQEVGGKRDDSQQEVLVARGNKNVPFPISVYTFPAPRFTGPPPIDAVALTEPETDVPVPEGVDVVDAVARLMVVGGAGAASSARGACVAVAVWLTVVAPLTVEVGPLVEVAIERAGVWEELGSDEVHSAGAGDVCTDVCTEGIDGRCARQRNRDDYGNVTDPGVRVRRAGRDWQVARTDSMFWMLWAAFRELHRTCENRRRTRCSPQQW